MSYESSYEKFHKKRNAILFFPIESAELKTRLEKHNELIIQSNAANTDQRKGSLPRRASFFFEKHADEVRWENYGFSIRSQEIDDSILSLITEGFESLRITRNQTMQQISEISESEFLEAVKVPYLNFAENLSLDWHRSETLKIIAVFYFSYALTLVSAKKLLLIALEMHNRALNSDEITFESFLIAVETIAQKENADQPIEWMLPIV